MVYKEIYEKPVKAMFLVLWILKIQRLQLSECSPEVIFLIVWWVFTVSVDWRRPNSRGKGA